MNCPVCKTNNLQPLEIEPGLSAFVCKTCGGKWIPFESYVNWHSQLSGKLPEIPADDAELSIPEFELARLCPKCRRILVKYNIGRNISFKIDRCGNCAGVWLDEIEWDVLRRRNLHDDLQNIFTDHWQAEVSREETRKTLESIYRSKFGEDDFKKLKDFKAWADSHEKSSEIISFLRDKNPLQF